MSLSKLLRTSPNWVPIGISVLQSDDDEKN
jgi:hypothetical protein